MDLVIFVTGLILGGLIVYFAREGLHKGQIIGYQTETNYLEQEVKALSLLPPPISIQKKDALTELHENVMAARDEALVARGSALPSFQDINHTSFPPPVSSASWDQGADRMRFILRPPPK